MAKTTVEFALGEPFFLRRVLAMTMSPSFHPSPPPLSDPSLSLFSFHSQFVFLPGKMVIKTDMCSFSEYRVRRGGLWIGGRDGRKGRAR